MKRILALLAALILIVSACAAPPAAGTPSDNGTAATGSPGLTQSGEPGDPTGSDPSDSDNRAAMAGILTASDYESLLAEVDRQTTSWTEQNERLYRKFAQPQMTPGGTMVMEEATDSAAGMGLGGFGGDGGGDHSQTNVQVEGVDEADLIKTDGRFLYVVANNRVYIVDSQDPGRMKLASTLRFVTHVDTDRGGRGENVAELYLDETSKRLTVLVTGYNYQDWKTDSYTLTLVYDIADPYKPVELRRFAQEGNYVASRRIGDQVYVVSQKYYYRVMPYPEPYPYPMDGVALPEGGAPALAPDQWSGRATTGGDSGAGEAADDDPLAVFPKISEAGPENLTTLAPDRIAIVDQGDPYNQVVLASVNTRLTAEPAEVLAVLGSSGTVYASATNLYLFGQKTVWTSEGDLNESSTLIFRYHLDRGQIRASGQGEVPGYVLNQFSFDEYQGHLRVATTTGQLWMTRRPSENNLFVLDDDLKIVGKLTGLAANETIRSVRFMGDRGAIVTFRTTDPLFLLDLSDPTNPRVTGELKIPGYSAYLHPWRDDMLVGFGYDVGVEGDRAFEKGLKISLFDISKPAFPREVSTLLMGSQGSYTEINSNHRALVADPRSNILAFPALLAKTSSGSPLEYGQPYFQGLIVLEVVDNRLRLKGGISHFDLSQTPNGPIPSMTEDDAMRFHGFDQVLRGAFIGDTLFTFSQHQILASRRSNLTPVSTLELPGYLDQYSWWTKQDQAASSGIIPE